MSALRVRSWPSPIVLTRLICHLQSIDLEPRFSVDTQVGGTGAERAAKSTAPPLRIAAPEGEAMLCAKNGADDGCVATKQRLRQEGTRGAQPRRRAARGYLSSRCCGLRYLRCRPRRLPGCRWRQRPSAKQRHWPVDYDRGHGFGHCRGNPYRQPPAAVQPVGTPGPFAHGDLRPLDSRLTTPPTDSPAKAHR